jgi:hypothetical protein
MDCHDADLPADPEFRATLVGCLKWGTRLTGPGALRAVTSASLYHTVLAPLGFRLAGPVASDARMRQRGGNRTVDRPGPWQRRL